MHFLKLFRFIVILAKNCLKRQKTEGSGFRCYQMRMSQKKPNLHYFTVGFGAFEHFLAKSHLVTCQNRIIWRFGKKMLGLYSLAKSWGFFRLTIMYFFVTIFQVTIHGWCCQPEKTSWFRWLWILKKIPLKTDSRAQCASTFCYCFFKY